MRQKEQKDALLGKLVSSSICLTMYESNIRTCIKISWDFDWNSSNCVQNHRSSKSAVCLFLQRILPEFHVRLIEAEHYARQKSSSWSGLSSPWEALKWKKEIQASQWNREFLPHVLDFLFGHYLSILVYKNCKKLDLPSPLVLMLRLEMPMGLNAASVHD